MGKRSSQPGGWAPASRLGRPGRRWAVGWTLVRTHLFDLAVVLLPFLRPLRALRALRGLGELRALRLLQASRLAAFLGTGFGHAHEIIRRRGLHYVVALAAATMLAAAGLEVAFEAHAKGSTIHNYGDALWWSVVTVTSVGYGDESPVTDAGRAVAVVLMITGIALFGVVAASIASYFVEQDTDRRVEARMDEILTVLHASKPGSTPRSAGLRPPPILFPRLPAPSSRPPPTLCAGSDPHRRSPVRMATAELASRCQMQGAELAHWLHLAGVELDLKCFKFPILAVWTRTG